jgi:hypothetical protein
MDVDRFAVAASDKTFRPLCVSLWLLWNDR